MYRDPTYTIKLSYGFKTGEAILARSVPSANAFTDVLWCSALTSHSPVFATHLVLREWKRNCTEVGEVAPDFDPADPKARL